MIRRSISLTLMISGIAWDEITTPVKMLWSKWRCSTVANKVRRGSEALYTIVTSRKCLLRVLRGLLNEVPQGNYLCRNNEQNPHTFHVVRDPLTVLGFDPADRSSGENSSMTSFRWSQSTKYSFHSKRTVGKLEALTLFTEWIRAQNYLGRFCVWT